MFSSSLISAAQEPVPSSETSQPPSVGATTTPAPPTGPGLGPETHLDTGAALGVAVLIAVTAIAIGLVIIRARTGRWFQRSSSEAGAASDGEGEKSIMRAWLAIALIVGLLVFGAVTFAIDDAQLRSTLIGGLVASAGSAIAYYFSSKNADTARKDILDAVFQLTTVPDVENLTIDNARAKAESVGLRLVEHPAGAAGQAVVQRQEPTAGATVRRGEAIHVDA